MALTLLTVTAQLVDVSTQAVPQTEYLLQQPQEVENHNHPLLVLFSTPKPVANHLKGMN